VSTKGRSLSSQPYRKQLETNQHFTAASLPLSYMCKEAVSRWPVRNDDDLRNKNSDKLGKS
jgi:hypothetical protein